jgi:hypothetical protein
MEVSPSVGVVDAGVAGHDFEHELLGDEKTHSQSFGYEGQFLPLDVAQDVVKLVDDALGITGLQVLLHGSFSKGTLARRV